MGPAACEAENIGARPHPGKRKNATEKLKRLRGLSRTEGLRDGAAAAGPSPAAAATVRAGV